MYAMINKEAVLPYKADFEHRLFSIYPELLQIEKNCWFQLINQSLFFNAPPKTIMHTVPGAYDHFILLIEGETRVYQADASGREVTFYRNYPGDVCPMNLDNLFTSRQSKAYIRSETAVHALQISSRAFHQALKDSDTFKHFVFSHMSRRFSELTNALEDMVFKKLDTRLAQLLEKLFNQAGKDTLDITHQQLANELGTTREVISRSLKAFENNGGLKITRGQLTMVSAEKLRQ